VGGWCRIAYPAHWRELQLVVRIFCFPLTAVLNAGMSQIFCGAAVGKTRGSPCLGGYKINGPIDGSHAALSLDLRDAPAPPQTHCAAPRVAET
jgi:hypothetical protein